MASASTGIVVFADRYGCWGLLDLWRYDGERSLADELRLLATPARPVTAGLRAAIARTFVDPGRQLHPLGPAVVVLDPDLHVRSQTEAAADALLRLNPPDEPMAPIPAAVAYNIAAALVAQEHGMPVGPPWSRIHLGGSRWVTVKASRLGTDIAVSIEPSTAADRLDIYARACGLTRRESEVLALLCEGLDTRGSSPGGWWYPNTPPATTSKPSSPRPEPAPGSSSSPAGWARGNCAPNAQPSPAVRISARRPTAMSHRCGAPRPSGQLGR